MTHIGRLGGLAVGLGVGVAVAATPGIAAADTGDPVSPVDGGAAAVLGGDTYVPFLAEANITTVVNPLDTQVIGDQQFDVDGLAGTPIDGFVAEVKDTTFIFGPSDQYIDVLGNVAGRVPPETGSIVNTINYGGGFENAYSDIVGFAPGSAPADEIITPFGDFAVPTWIVEALGPSAFIPSAATISSSSSSEASATDPSSLTNASDLGTAAASSSNAASSAALATGSGNEYDPAVVPYSADPSNLFAPVYTIAPIGPEGDVTESGGNFYGTQDFGVSSLGIQVDTFTGNVEYTPFQEGNGLAGILGELAQLLGLSGGYTEEITTPGSAGSVLPEQTAFLISEYGFGYGNVFEESINAAGTSATVGDFVLTPFGDWNISPIVDLFATTTAG